MGEKRPTRSANKYISPPDPEIPSRVQNLEEGGTAPGAHSLSGIYNIVDQVSCLGALGKLPLLQVEDMIYPPLALLQIMSTMH